MVIIRLFVTLFVLVAFSSQIQASENETLPQVKSRISDHAAVLTYSQEHQLHQILTQHQFAKRQSVMVLTAETSIGYSPQHYAERIWQAWTSKKKSNSVLLVLLKEEKSAAIVVGKDLKKQLSKEAAKKLITDSVATPLSQGDYDNAALEGVKAILVELNS